MARRWSARPHLAARGRRQRGVLVDPEDADRLGGALQRVLSDQHYADDLRARGLARARQFTWEQVAAQTSALYAEVTGTQRD